ncbi:hypothetical protein [Amnibacterium soli]|uniref:hypothetical protein n=1 Tax=Amnibacterium soli TaxID=1282736 RepID=UPI0031EBE68A
MAWPDLFTGWAEPTTTIVETPDGVWVHYGLLNSVRDEDPLAAAVNDLDAPAVYIRTATGATSVVRVGRDQVLGATLHGLWTTSHLSPDPDHDHPYLGGPLPGDWHEDTPITIHRPDGTRRQITVDRDVLAVDATGQHVRVLVHASPPIAIPGEDGSTSYQYRPTELLLLADLPLPDRIRFRDLVPEGWGAPTDFDRQGWPQRATMIPAVTHGTPDAEGDWTVVELPPDLRQQAVAFTIRQFEHLEQYWHPEDGSSAHPLSDGLHDATVHVVGDYPHTRVEVTFRHPAYPAGHLRRTYPVYDPAGRIRVDEDLAIWLMEDLDTRDLPPATAAVDGILHI